MKTQNSNILIYNLLYTKYFHANNYIYFGVLNNIIRNLPIIINSKKRTLKEW